MEYFWLSDHDEKPLDQLVEDGGFCGIFRTIGCVGDSLASGEYEIINKDGTHNYYDLYEYSWGQYISYATGSKVYNFSKGGMTALEYNESFAEENDFWNPSKACQAYIIALGVNDLIYRGFETGSVKDICMENPEKNKKTFAGEYGKIIQRLKKIQPEAKFFLITMPKHSENVKKGEEHAALMHEIAKVFTNTYVIDLRKYGPEYDKAFCEMFFYNNHMNPCGYQLTAKMIMSYIDYLIRHKIDEFKLSGMIGYERG